MTDPFLTKFGTALQERYKDYPITIRTDLPSHSLEGQPALAVWHGPTPAFPNHPNGFLLAEISHRDGMLVVAWSPFGDTEYELAQPAILAHFYTILDLVARQGPNAAHPPVPVVPEARPVIRYGDMYRYSLETWDGAQRFGHYETRAEAEQARRTLEQS
jgi:hypothetical protein